MAVLSHRDSKGQSSKGRRAVRVRVPTLGCPVTGARLSGSSPGPWEATPVLSPLCCLNGRPSRTRVTLAGRRSPWPSGASCSPSPRCRVPV